MNPIFSIITPTHDPAYLRQAYESLVAQTLDSWEWILAPNNGCSIPDFIAEDPRVKVIPVPFETTHVGALKKFAFGQGRGEVLVEFDHDDELTPDCLAELSGAFTADHKIGFVYSYAARIGRVKKFGINRGWEYDWLDYGGKKLFVPKTFEPSAGSLAYGWYAPDHVRAWLRETYIEVGGHDETMEVGDDFDLLARTYLATRMKLIPRALYIYRVTGDNTWLRKNSVLQPTIHSLYTKYIVRLAERWADINGLYRLDLGGAINPASDYLTLDIESPCDIQSDLSKGIPFPDNSVGVVRANDFLSHIRDQKFMMAEIHRVLADGGWLISRTPSTDGRGAFQDPSHQSYWNQNSFWYWTKPESAKYIRNASIRFQEFRCVTIFPTERHKKNNIPYVFAELSAVKSGARRPHFLPPWGA